MPATGKRENSKGRREQAFPQVTGRFEALTCTVANPSPEFTRQRSWVRVPYRPPLHLYRRSEHIWPAVRPGPSIVVTSPADGAIYAQNQMVVPSFACTDPGGSGVKKCNGPAKVSTQSTGANVFVVKATDEAGNDSATTIHYVVAS